MMPVWSQMVMNFLNWLNRIEMNGLHLQVENMPAPEHSAVFHQHDMIRADNENPR